MILQISVEFKEAYELLVSAWAAAFVKQQGSLDLSREWFNWCQAKLSPQNLVLIDEIRRMEQAVPIALLLSCPHAGAAEFVKWVGSLSGKEAYEIIYSFDPNTQRRPPESLRKMCQVLAKGLGMWHEQYFSRIANKVTGELAEIAAAGRVRAKDFEQRPQELVKELTQSLVWEADAVTEITMIPQGHLSPWPVYVIGGDHGVVFYPVSGSVLPREDGTARLERVLRAVADPSRIQLLRAIGNGVIRFTELVQRSGLAKSTVHHHLVALRLAGLLWLHVGDDASARFSIRWEAVRSLSADLERVLQGK
ncbi:MAG: winged helix-turn-helix transcriptional regulator [Firmicutes bacterium]|jgi:DNA-binding transcriptional ArsR family regulator|nr:winged helix-turn-helix transcriptional regulator [Bacillota bacterium]